MTAPPEPDGLLREWVRRRIEHEDGLLANRTNLFLVVNALGAVAVGLDGAPQLQIALVLIVANVPWLICGLQTRAAIQAATELYFQKKESGEIFDPADDAVRKALDRVPRNWYSTDILGFWIPLLVLSGWLIGTFAGMS